MGAPVGNWLSAEFSVLGIHFQNWMLVAVALVALFILYWWVKERRPRS
jgi:membrane protein DedA with SNARE-associated domain